VEREPAPDLDDDAAALTDAELAEMRPAREVLPPEVYATLVARRSGRPKAAPETKKVPVTLRLDPDVLEGFKAQGPGWQTRINAVLRRALDTRAAKAGTKAGATKAGPASRAARRR
jgi:uncharacterized protein (DUF4415 family)